ncbi:polysaccharide deacetylase family protein [Pseudonocardia adelaidensis]|uniref:NodB homology domain-containing protein n=1 Tax=Pseudonocardia adelaidensis TaxID=648754 RepID=A0ABP9N929_9PSEU
MTIPTSSPRTIPILLYHSVSAAPADWIAPLAVTPTTFAHHLDVIVSRGHTGLTVSHLRDALRGRTPWPERPVVVTFDDGFADFADAAEQLIARRLPSTLYVTTGALRGRGSPAPELRLPPAHMLSWSQLAELTQRGVEIGAHTHTHPQLDVLPAGLAAQEIRRGKDLLEDELGREVPSFAYPYGFHRDSVRRSVRMAGYTSACAVKNALSSPPDDQFALARLTIRADTDTARLQAWLAGRQARIAPYPEKMTTRAWRLYRRTGGWRGKRLPNATNATRS